MSSIFFHLPDNSPIEAQGTPMPIRAGAGVPITEAKPSPGDACLRPYANARMNSRLTGSLPSETWKARWQTDLPLDFLPEALMQFGNRILAQGVDLWLLLDLDGKTIRQGGRTPGDLLLDPANGLFYHVKHSGYVQARQMTDGEESFSFFPLYGEGYRRSVLARRGSRMLLHSFELPQMMAERVRTPDLTIVELKELGDPIQKDEQGYLTSDADLTNLCSRTIPMLVAVDGDAPVLAAPGHLFLADQDLTIRADLTGDFQPVSMSLDEAGRIYLIAQTQGGAELWVVAQNGERQSASPLPEGASARGLPPIIGWDHTVYMVVGDTAVAIAPDGAKRWEHALSGSFGGASVTADGQLLIGSGSELLALDVQGNRRVVHNFAGEHLATAPILTTTGELLVASHRRLFCLTYER
jgi:hypothetical protein